jgi:hypothetical protein
MIKLEKYIRNAACFVVVRDTDQDISIGSVEINEMHSGLIPFLEIAIDNYNRSKQEPEAATITGAPRTPR